MGSVAHRSPSRTFQLPVGSRKSPLTQAKYPHRYPHWGGARICLGSDAIDRRPSTRRAGGVPQVASAPVGGGLRSQYRTLFDPVLSGRLVIFSSSRVAFDQYRRKFLAEFSGSVRFRDVRRDCAVECRPLPPPALRFSTVSSRTAHLFATECHGYCQVGAISYERTAQTPEIEACAGPLPSSTLACAATLIEPLSIPSTNLTPNQHDLGTAL